jgi:hypothetical protein
MTIVTKWRGDREAGREWPHELHRGGPFPWTGDTVAPNTRRNFYEPNTGGF